MSAESPDERAESADPAGSEPTVDKAAGEAEASGAEAEQSYEERVLNELVPEISVGDETADGEPVDSDPESTTETDLDGSLADALGKLDEELQQAFIRIVVGIKLGVLLISAGILAIGFRGMITAGGGLIAVGGLAFARAGHRYWTYEHTSDDSRNG